MSLEGLAKIEHTSLFQNPQNVYILPEQIMWNSSQSKLSIAMVAVKLRPTNFSTLHEHYDATNALAEYVSPAYAHDQLKLNFSSLRIHVKHVTTN